MPITLDTDTELALKAAWPHLSRQERHTFYLIVIKGLHRQETADAMGLAKGTVDHYLFRISRIKSRARSMPQVYAYYAIRYNQELGKDHRSQIGDKRWRKTCCRS